MAIRRIGQIFVDMGFVSDEQLEMLLEEQQQRPGTLLGKIGLEDALAASDNPDEVKLEMRGIMKGARAGQFDSSSMIKKDKEPAERAAQPY